MMTEKIKMPIMTHKFRVLGLVSPHVYSLTIDYAANKIRMIVRATVDPKDYRNIVNYSTGKNDITIEHLSNGGEVLFSLVFYVKRLITHEYKLSYADNNLATHEIEWEFASYSILEKQEIWSR